MNRIPIDQLKNKTSTGFQIKIFTSNNTYDNVPQIAHRDDHYIFFLLKSGSGVLQVDSKRILVTGKSLYYILPSQVHYRIKADQADGWFIAVDPSIILPDSRDTLERNANQIPFNLSEGEFGKFNSLLDLLHKEFIDHKRDQHYLTIVHSLLQSFLAMAARSFDSSEIVFGRHTRSADLTRQFKELLFQNVHTMKSPSQYSSKLNVSTGYLNEAVKKVTGSTLSYWIGQEVVNEAKRLLLHTDADIQQVAHSLGYSDFSYFLRVFRNHSGLSPLAFRKQNLT
jgi:AraC family transcriptional activator of pobA